MNTNGFLFYNSKKYKLTLSLSIAIFFYVFIVFFLPFGVDNYNPNHQYTFEFFFEIFKFFIPLLLISLANEFLLRPLFIKKATFNQIILWTLWTLYLLSSVIFITYNYLGNWHDFNLSSYLEFLIQVPAVFIFPITVVFFFFKYRSIQNQMEHILTTKDKAFDETVLIKFKGQGNKDQIILSMGSFLYGKAQDNYVELYYLENDQLKKFLLRSSLSKLSDSLDDSIIVRCHRSYMVNLLHVNSITGGNNELKLHLNLLKDIIPVSKSYQDTTLSNLHKIKNFA